MSNSHTLGPWSFSTQPQPNGCPIVGARGLMVAMLAHSICFEDQRQTALANARLIAAAPELLEDLREAAKTLRRYQDLHIAKGTPESMGKASANAALAERFEATIAKATGAVDSK